MLCSPGPEADARSVRAAHIDTMPLSAKALGLPTPSTTEQAPDPGSLAPVTEPEPLVPRSTTARALYAVWSGAPVTVVDSPPGAGKTHLAATVAAHLAQAGFTIRVATPTRAQASGFARRLSAQVNPRRIEVAVKDLPLGSLPQGMVGGRWAGGTAAAPKRPAVTICTVASAALSPPQCDVMIVDEAYQTTFADLVRAADGARQVLLVGDPGQIGPVVSVSTELWDRLPNPPHRRSPECFSRLEGAQTLTIGESRRLGPVTVKTIAPLYDFEFGSSRPPCTASWDDVTPLAEIETLRTAPAAHADDPTLLRAVADRAAALIGIDLSRQVRAVGGGVTDTLWTAEDTDVAVVVSRNSQVAVVRGLLHAAGADKVTVGTADKLQGGEWPLVVALDPAAGGSEDDHAMSPGRLAVMASRHTHHLTWVTDGSVPEHSGRARREVCRRLASQPPA